VIVERVDVTREEVIRSYATYDLRKKRGKSLISDSDFAEWPWDDPDGIDGKLAENGLKEGVLAAYLTWRLVKLSIADLLECAVVNRIFPGEPRALGQLLLRGRLAEWFPIGTPRWWRQLANGSDFDEESALIVRPALKCEAPARWYLEDGSGRALALLQRILRYGETERTARAYVGYVADERSTFIKDHRELCEGASAQR
jgi:hypothetical protein